jgi:hypothetical protein
MRSMVEGGLHTREAGWDPSVSRLRRLPPPRSGEVLDHPNRASAASSRSTSAA